jgi:hypothetical protein
MIMRRSLPSSVILLLLLGVAGGLVWGDRSAHAANVSSTKTILVKGTVSTNVPEAIPFSGKVQIKTVVVPDPDFGQSPIVRVSIDLLDVQGLGQTTKTKYIAVDEDELNRAFVPSDQLGLTFVIVTDTDRVAPVGVGLFTLTLTFDGVGNLTDAIGSIADSTFAPNL